MIDNSNQMVIAINHQNGVYLKLVHDPLNFRNLRFRRDDFRLSCHNVIHSMIEEVCLPPLHSPSDIAIRYESDHLVIAQRDAQA